jgi:hypothetical protein
MPIVFDRDSCVKSALEERDDGAACRTCPVLGICVRWRARV